MAGGIAIVIGLLVILSGIGQTDAHELRLTGMLLMAFGALTAAIPLYIDARHIQAKNAPKQAANQRGVSRCVLCGKDATFSCTTHLLSLCADCVPRHHDTARCLYKPLIRADRLKKAKAQSY